MDAAQVTCVVCGENEFYLSNGNFFCKECHTQTSDLKEQEVNETLNFVTSKSLTQNRKRKIDESSITNALTTWECYNYITLGWVKELIKLGASEELKEIVEKLWFHYLEKTEVIHKNTSKLPKLSLYKHKRDCEILYGRPKYSQKQKRKKKNKKETGTELSQLRRKNRLINELSQHFINPEQNATTSNNNELNGSRKILFSKHAKMGLKKMLGNTNFRKYQRDLNGKMTVNFKDHVQFLSKHRDDIEIISPLKALSLVYLGLLIIKDKIYLCDFIRFIHEGHISYNNFRHFFPEDVNTSAISNDLGHLLPHYSTFQETIVKMASFLDVINLIPIQNLVERCKRFCLELNLPDEMENYVINLISASRPYLKVQHDQKIPNYDGRAISFIIFALKILFGLDGLTEFKFSDLAKSINKNSTKHKMFNFKTWFNFITYRNLIISEHHFPSEYISKKDSRNIENFINFSNKNDVREIDESYDDLLEMLGELPDALSKNNIEFPSSLTPYHDYLNIILKSGIIEEKGGLKKHLLHDFQNTKISYLVQQEKYVNTSATVVHGGAKSFKVVPYISSRSKWYYGPGQVCELVDDKNHLYNNEIASTSTSSDDFLEEIQDKYKKFDKTHNGRFRESEKKFKYAERSSKAVDCTEVYLPEEKFWIHHIYARTRITEEEFNEFYEELPYTFRIIIEECARIVRHSIREMIDEYIFLEMYMCYYFNRDSGVNLISGLKLASSMKKVIKNW